MGDFYVDIKFAICLLFAGNILSALLMLVYWGWDTNNKQVQLFLLTKVLLPVAWAIRVFGSPLGEHFLVITSNSLLFVSAALEMSALLQIKHYDLRTFHKKYACILSACIFLFAGISFLGANEDMRIVLSALIFGLLMGLPLTLLFRDKCQSRLQRLITLIYSFILLFILSRGIIAFFALLQFPFPSIDSHNSWVLITIYLLMLIGGTGFLLLGKESYDKALLKAATYDGLTEMLNRTSFIAKANEIIHDCFLKQTPLAFMIIDIDDFKKINDGFGHYVGDAVLQDFALQLKGCLRKHDLSGRFGGEEFVVLIPGIDEKITQLKAEQLRRIIEHASFKDCAQIQYTISIGYCNVIPKEDTTIDLLYRICDDALYQAKSEGKNCCQSAILA